MTSSLTADSKCFVTNSIAFITFSSMSMSKPFLRRGQVLSIEGSTIAVAVVVVVAVVVEIGDIVVVVIVVTIVVVVIISDVVSVEFVIKDEVINVVDVVDENIKLYVVDEDGESSKVDSRCDISDFIDIGLGANGISVVIEDSGNDTGDAIFICSYADESVSDDTAEVLVFIELAVDDIIDVALEAEGGSVVGASAEVTAIGKTIPKRVVRDCPPVSDDFVDGASRIDVLNAAESAYTVDDQLDDIVEAEDAMDDDATDVEGSFGNDDVDDDDHDDADFDLPLKALEFCPRV